MEPEKQLHTFLDGGNLIYFPQYLADEEATELLQLLHYSEDSVNGCVGLPCFLLTVRNIPWALNKVGEKANIPEARITALLGEADGLTYSYSFQTKVASKWPAEVHQVHYYLVILIQLFQLKTKLEAIVGHPYNVVLCNWYQSGKNFVGWHSDDETDLVEGNLVFFVLPEFQRIDDCLYFSRRNQIISVSPQQGCQDGLRPNSAKDKDELRGYEDFDRSLADFCKAMYPRRKKKEYFRTK